MTNSLEPIIYATSWFKFNSWTLATPKFRSLERHLNISVQMSTHLKLARRWYCVGWTNKAIRFHSNGEVLAILYCAEFWDQWICLFIYLTVRKLGWIDKTFTLTHSAHSLGVLIFVFLCSHLMIKTSCLGWFTAYLAHSLLTKLQFPILPRRSLDRINPKHASQS